MGRLPRHKRVNNPPPMRLMERDIEILKTVHDYRILRGDQLQALFFGSQSTASYRLSRLYQHGFLDRRFLPTLGGLASSPALYVLGKRGVDVLRRVLDCGPKDIRKPPGNQELSPLFLEHLLQINDFRLAVTLAARNLGYTLELWLDDYHLKANFDRVAIRTPQGQRRVVSLIPDAYCVLRVPQGRGCFFLEMDRGTMTNARFRDKVLAYKAYIASGQYEQRYGTRSLRVLTVTSGPKRLENLKKEAEQVRGGRVFWFTTSNCISADAVLHKRIWLIAGDNGYNVFV
ncbi:replication-relaxation family protein [Aggregatilinea lenta]|uniref:replication-relaxation family protein n=1 Tax=Aggregatilinea lenta TaxID=913108 RepID=UPI000E5BD883|nr:replication-relaxation family protein [Aggregatilinea lenta]